METVGELLEICRDFCAVIVVLVLQLRLVVSWLQLQVSRQLIAIYCNDMRWPVIIILYVKQMKPTNRLGHVLQAASNSLANGFAQHVIYIYIEWASARVPPTPLCGGGRAGSVNKTTGKVKTIINDHIPSRVMEEKINSEAES